MDMWQGFTIVMLAGGLSITGAASVSVAAEPKLSIIEYSWTTVDTKYLHDNVAEIRKRPFDGVSVFVAHPRLPHGSVLSGAGRGDLGWMVFQNHRATREMIEPAIRDLKTTPFKKLRSNYVVVVSYLPNRQSMNWFDDAWWANIAENARLMAAVAKQGGCEGILLDPEEYGCHFWGYGGLKDDPLYKGRSFQQVNAKVRRRGRQFIEAINRAYPGIRILLLHAWQTVLHATQGDKAKLPDVGYGLLPAFLDGMLEASHPDTILIDGIELGYYVEQREEFVRLADSVRRDGPKLSDVPEAFRKKVRTGFGIWMDRDRHWDPVNVEKNRWPPEKFTKIVTNALLASDGFVWIYNERPTWLLDSGEAKLGGGIDFGDPQRNNTIRWLPRVYWQALEQARANALRELSAKTR